MSDTTTIAIPCVFRVSPARLGKETRVWILSLTILTAAYVAFMVVQYVRGRDVTLPLLGFAVLIVPILPFVLPAGIATWRDVQTEYVVDGTGFVRKRPGRPVEDVRYDSVTSIRVGMEGGGEHLHIVYSTDSAEHRIDIPLLLEEQLVELMRFLDALQATPAAVAFEPPVRHLLDAWRAADVHVRSPMPGELPASSREALEALAHARFLKSRKLFHKAEKTGDQRLTEALLLECALDEIENTRL